MFCLPFKPVSSRICPATNIVQLQIGKHVIVRKLVIQYKNEHRCWHLHLKMVKLRNEPVSEVT